MGIECRDSGFNKRVHAERAACGVDDLHVVLRGPKTECVSDWEARRARRTCDSRDLALANEYLSIDIRRELSEYEKERTFLGDVEVALLGGKRKLRGAIIRFAAKVEASVVLAIGGGVDGVYESVREYGHSKWTAAAVAVCSLAAFWASAVVVRKSAGRFRQEVSRIAYEVNIGRLRHEGKIAGKPKRQD